jgi:hypothetical protein
VCWPEAPLATRAAAGARFVVLVGGIGVVIVVVFNVALWSDAAAAISALLLMAFALRRRKLIAIAASLALIAGFAISISGAVLGPFNALQGFHILLILSFSLMGWEAQVKVQ